MTKFFFILGKNPLLSLIEIVNLADYHELGFQIVDLTSEILIIQSKQTKIIQWQARLGGTIKLGLIVNEFPNLRETVGYLTADNLLKNLLIQHDKKIVYGFSLYGDQLRSHKSQFRDLGIQLKRGLQSRDFKCRFIEAKDGSLSSVQLEKNKLINSGADIVVASGLHAIYLGKTLAVQDFEDYSYRDYGRPMRDSRSGMLPPKLAKMMINISQAEPNSQLLDPFCGSGTIIQEAILMGFKNIIGGDISTKAIEDTLKNMSWLKEKYRLPEINFKLYQSDIKELDKHLAPLSVDTIVTEPFLGPPLKKNIGILEMLPIIQNLENLYLSAFNIFTKILKPTAKVIIIFPLFKTEIGIFCLKILESLEKMGFHRVNPIPNKVSLFAKVGPTARGSLIYQRPDQTIQREIFIFQRQKS